LEDARPTPEDIARGDIPEPYVRVPATEYSPDGLHAAVFLLTNEPPAVEEYIEFCYRTEDGWIGESGVSGLGRGGHSVGDFGVTYLWEQAPPGALSARVRTRHGVKRVPVRDGYVIYALWDTNCTFDDELELLTFA